jgi:exopolysaccharide biosynthesis polyprenyl glycosylphosphotransferase
MLALADLIAVLTGCVVLGLSGPGQIHQALWAALLAPIWLVVAKVLGIYDRDQRSLRHLTVDELPRLLTWALVGTAIAALCLAATPSGSLSAGDAIRLGVIAGFAVLALRVLARFVWRRVTPPERAIIIGDGALAAAARRKLELFPDMHIHVVEELPELDVEGLRSVSEVVSGVDRIMLATTRLDEQLIAELVALCRQSQTKLSVVPPARGMFGTAVELNHVADLPVMEYNTWDVSRSTLLLKRAIDVIAAGTMLIVFAPLACLVVAMILIDDGRPVLFRQVRVGQNGRMFQMLKFRTMVRDAEQMLSDLVPFDSLHEPMFKLTEDPRVTLVGRLLRRTSLDELPQFLNVLAGNMSLVGPRPEQLEVVELYTEQDRFRLAVKPGVTGPMQVYGRGSLTFEERAAVEREYIENISVARDMHIFALTMGSVFSGRGAF